jgi:hypothetical protein
LPLIEKSWIEPAATFQLCVIWVKLPTWSYARRPNWWRSLFVVATAYVSGDAQGSGDPPRDLTCVLNGPFSVAHS